MQEIHPPDDDTEDIMHVDMQSPPNPNEDIAQQNILPLTHNLLYVIELLCAISDWDWGHIEDILGNLAMMFCGTRSNNYCVEILHFIHNLKKVWTPNFAQVFSYKTSLTKTYLLFQKHYVRQ